MEALEGPERSAMLAELGREELETAFAQAGGETAADTALKLKLAGRDPDSPTSQIAYEKGFLFLKTLEQAVGRERFDAWLRSWFDRNAFRPQTSEGLLADLRANLFKGDKALEARVKPEAFIYQPGLPDTTVRVRSDAFAKVEAAAETFAKSGAVAAVPFARWSSQEQVRFLASLPRTLPRARLDGLERAFSLNAVGNAEVRFAWLMLVVATRYDPALPSLEQFLTSQGRRKFVLPLYTALEAQAGWGPAIARRIYARARSGYHPVTASSVDTTLKLRPSS